VDSQTSKTICKNCGSENVIRKVVNMHIGHYCGDCGKWIVWLDQNKITLTKDEQAQLHDNKVKKYGADYANFRIKA
jgi:hypothetical protein